MRLLILADLHHDFWASNASDHARLRAGLDAVGPVDAVILAGDISNKARVRWKAAFDDLSAVCDRRDIHVSLGNHDFYDHRIDGLDRLQEVADACGVTWAVDRHWVWDGVRFAVTPLWVDHRLDGRLESNRDEVERVMNDFRLIRVAQGGYRRLRARDVEREHERHLAFLDGVLSTPFEGPTVVVSHHAPHPDVLLPGEAPRAAYASDLSDFLTRHAKASSWWFHGHAHRGMDVDRCGWKIRNVSLGYPSKDVDVHARLLNAIWETDDLKPCFSESVSF